VLVAVIAVAVACVMSVPAFTLSAAALRFASVTAPAAPSPAPLPPASREVRKAVWHQAGVLRHPERLEQLLTSEHPMARLVAACALHRRERRGAHWRLDAEGLDHALDRKHTIVTIDGAPRMETWA